MRKSYPDKVLGAVVELLFLMRQEQGLSHETLARQSGLTRPAISFIEAGKRKPSLLVCLKIAQGLGVSLGKVLIEAERRVRGGDAM